METKLLFLFEPFSVCVALLILQPATVSGQDWTVTSAPSQDWSSVASSADGTTLVAGADTYPNGGPLLVSTNSGASWTEGEPCCLRTNWRAVACSADGTRMIAASTLIYGSTNSGLTWTEMMGGPGGGLPSGYWSTVACSANGMTLFAGIGYPSGALYISTNLGTTWTGTSAPNLPWRAVACSADGLLLVAASHGSLYVSTNGGAGWNVPDLPGQTWSSVAVSASGRRAYAAARGVPGGNPATYMTPQPIYVSSDFGASWSPAPDLHDWQSVACSADGASVIAVGTLIVSYGPFKTVVYTSSNAGASWNLHIEDIWEERQTVACSADGARVVRSIGRQILTWARDVVPPRLSAAGHEQLTLSWLTPSTRFVLQQTSSLTQPGWSDVNSQPSLNYSNLNQEVSLAAPSGPMFYRLVSR